MTATLAKQFVAAKKYYSVQYETEVKSTPLIGVENCPPAGFKHSHIQELDACLFLL